MNTYTLTFGRVVICKATIQAKSVEEALDIAYQMEKDGQLTLAPTTLNPNIEIDDVTDYESIWEIE